MLILQSISFSICSLNLQSLEMSKGLVLMRWLSRYSYLTRLQTLSLIVLRQVLPRYLCVLKQVRKKRSRGLLMFLQGISTGSVSLRDLKGLLQRQLARMLVISLLIILEVMTCVQIIIKCEKQQLIQMFDNFDCEQAVIRQYIKRSLEKCKEQPKDIDIVRLPLDIYRYSTRIFKRQQMINEFLCHSFQEIFYLRDRKQLSEFKGEEFRKLYLQLLEKQTSHKAFFLCQINLRCILLALSIKLNKKDTSSFRRKFKDFIKQLQLELVFNTQQILSDVIIKELKEMKAEFDALEYFEELKTMFEKCEADKGEMTEKRKKFEEKHLNSIPFKVEQKAAQQKSQNKETVAKTTKQEEKCKSIQKIQIQRKQTNQSKLISKTTAKDERIGVVQRQERLSCIRLANKLRSSLPSSIGRYSCKYIFKSSKKNLTQQVVYEDRDQTKSPSICEEIQNYPTQCDVSSPAKRQADGNEDGDYLCAATPPRRNARALGQR